MKRWGVLTSAFGPLLPLASVCNAFARRSGRARLRAGGPGRSDCGARPCGPGALRCSLREGGCDGAALPLNAAMPNAFSPVRRGRGGLPLAALRCSPPQIRALTHPPAALRETAWRSTDGNSNHHARHGGGCKDRGQCPDGAHLRRRGAEQSGGKSAAQRRTGEEDLGDAAFSGSAKPPQPPPRSEHRSAPSPQARAAQLSPGRALPSGLARSVIECAKRTKNGNNGPKPEVHARPRFMRRGSRESRRDN